MAQPIVLNEVQLDILYALLIDAQKIVKSDNQLTLAQTEPLFALVMGAARTIEKAILKTTTPQNDIKVMPNDIHGAESRG